MAMGFNTVVFLLNDFMRDIERSPKTVAWILTHPPMTEQDKILLADAIWKVAEEFGEKSPNPQALEVLTTFHADGTRYYRASKNQIDQLVEVGQTTRNGKRCVILELPQHLQGKHKRRG